MPEKIEPAAEKPPRQRRHSWERLPGEVNGFPHFLCRRCGALRQKSWSKGRGLRRFGLLSRGTMNWQREVPPCRQDNLDRQFRTALETEP